MDEYIEDEAGQPCDQLLGHSDYKGKDADHYW